jgi:hypothetical protein
MRTVLILLALVCPGTPTAQPPTWRWPLAGTAVVARGFDPPPLPWAAGHRGVDLRARAGEAVLAAGPGVVGFAGVLAGRGVVAVHHPGGLETTYEPLRVVVHAGERVSAGQLLGRVQPGHGDCGPGFVCLHWGLRRGDTYLDPLTLLGRGPVRLLPIWPAAPLPAFDVPDHHARGPTVGVAAAAAGGVGGAALLGVVRRRTTGRGAARS